MISIWIHLTVVLGLLASHGFTAYWAVRRIRELQEALRAKKVLLNELEPWEEDMLT